MNKNLDKVLQEYNSKLANSDASKLKLIAPSDSSKRSKWDHTGGLKGGGIDSLKVANQINLANQSLTVFAQGIKLHQSFFLDQTVILENPYQEDIDKLKQKYPKLASFIELTNVAPKTMLIASFAGNLFACTMSTLTAFGIVKDEVTPLILAGAGLILNSLLGNIQVIGNTGGITVAKVLIKNIKTANSSPSTENNSRRSSIHLM